MKAAQQELGVTDNGIEYRNLFMQVLTYFKLKFVTIFYHSLDRVQLSK